MLVAVVTMLAVVLVVVIMVAPPLLLLLLLSLPPVWVHVGKMVVSWSLVDMRVIIVVSFTLHG